MDSIFPIQIGGVTDENKNDLLSRNTTYVRFFGLSNFFFAVVLVGDKQSARSLLEDTLSGSEFTAIDAD